MCLLVFDDVDWEVAEWGVGADQVVWVSEARCGVRLGEKYDCGEFPVVLSCSCGDGFFEV